MKHNHILFSTLFVALAASAYPAQAQEIPEKKPVLDCGSVCESCGFLNLFREGRGVSTSGNYNMTCGFWECKNCPRKHAAAESAGATLLRTVLTASDPALPQEVATHRNRLLFDQSRRILAVRGVDCRSLQVVAASILSVDRAKALETLNIPTLESFFAEVRASRDASVRETDESTTQG